MAENINALILPIGADPSQFKESLNSVKAAFKDLSAKIAGTQFNLVTDEQKEQLSGLERTFKALGGELKNFGKDIEFPANSIAGITRKIDELNKRKISLDATTSSAEIASITQQVEKLIEKKNEINSLGKTLVEAFVAPANSIAGLDKKISDLNKKKINLDAKTSAAEIARLSQEIDKLTAKRNNIESLGQSVSKVGASTQGGFQKITDSAKNGRIALTSLSLVAQDLPFGFIAIQNNLPAVIASFGALSTASKGLSGSLIALKTALIGPAGLFLAFSVVIGAITFAVQKYGSIGNAVDAITNRNKVLTESQKALNEAVASTTGNLTVENGKAESLISTLNDLRLPQDQRLAAYNELLTVQPDVISGISEENALTADGIALLNENNKSLKERTRLKITEAGITSALNKTANTLAEKRFEETKLLAQEKVELDKYNKSLNDQPAAAKAAEQGINTYKLQLNNTRASLKEVQSGIKNLESEQETYLNQLEPITDGIAGINYELKLKANNLKKEQQELQNSIDFNKKYQQALSKFNQLKIELPEFDDSKSIDRKISALEKYGNIVLDTTNYDFERAAALKEIIEIDKEYFKNLDLTKTKLESLQGTIQNYIGYLYNVREIQKELAKPIDIKGVSDKIDTKIFIDTAKLRTDVPAIVDLLFPDDKFNKITEAWNKINKDTSPKLEDLKNKIRDALISKELITGVKSTYEEISNAINSALSGVQIGFEQEKKLADTEKQIKAFTERINNAIEDGLRRPLRDFFDTFLDTGKFAFDSFVKLAKDSFKRIAADLLASGLAKLLTSFLLPMAGGGAGGGLVNSLMSFLPPSRTRARFESMGQRRDGIGGQVNFVIRGTELVGVLNRGNQEINRIG
jgi:chromosome segregation ATPase